MNLFEINQEMDKLLKKYRSIGVHIEQNKPQVNLKEGQDKVFNERSSTPDNNKNTNLCHICDIQVPNAHMQDHVNSTTHIVLLKLANHATERINKHVSQQIEKLSFDSTCNSKNSDNNNSSSYYCEQCNLLLLKSAVESHKGDEEHQKSVNKEMFAEKLFKCYMGLNNEDVMEEISKWSSSNSSKESSKKRKRQEHEMENIETNNNLAKSAPNKTSSQIDLLALNSVDSATELFLQQLQLALETALMKEHVSRIEKSRKEIKSQCEGTASQEEMTVTELVNAMSAKESRVGMEVKVEVQEVFDGVNSQEILGDFAKEQMQIKALDGTTLSLSKQHYHGVHAVSGDGSCQLCNVTLASGERFTEHMCSERHLAAIAAPIADRNGLREVNINSSVRHQSLLCNTIHLHAKKHTSTEAHKKAMPKPTSNEPHKEAIPKHSSTEPQKKAMPKPTSTEPQKKVMPKPTSTDPLKKAMPKPTSTDPQKKAMPKPTSTEPQKKVMPKPTSTEPLKKAMPKPTSTDPQKKAMPKPTSTDPQKKAMPKPTSTDPQKKAMPKLNSTEPQKIDMPKLTSTESQKKAMTKPTSSEPQNKFAPNHTSTEPRKKAMLKPLPLTDKQVQCNSKIPYDISLTTADVEMVDYEQLPITRQQTNKNKQNIKKTIQKYRKPKHDNDFVYCNFCGVRLNNVMNVIIPHVNSWRHQNIASRASLYEIERNLPDVLTYFYNKEQNERRKKWRVEQYFYNDVYF